MTINKYKALYQPTELICGTGNVVVVSGWTYKEQVAAKLDSNQYAAIGQLFSPTIGINFLLRNLIANPHIKCLVVLESEFDQNVGSSQCLLDLFSNGFSKGKSDDTGRECWVIASNIPGYIDIEIPAEILSLLINSIQVHLVHTIDEIAQAINNYHSDGSSWLPEPLEFPFVEFTPTIFPGPRYGHRIEGKTIAETWVKIIHRVHTTGTLRPNSYGGKWQELINLTAVITDEPPDFYFPNPNYLPLDRDFLEVYTSQILEDAPYQPNVKYTYGQRLRSWFGCDQIQQVINKLIKEIDAASAVMSLWDVKDHDAGGSPCLNHVWLRVIDNELSLTATFRSNDMFSAWPSNAMGLRALQKHIRDEIAKNSKYDLKMGSLILNSESAHIYDHSFDSVRQIVKNNYHKILAEERRRYFDAVGNFIIQVESEKIVIYQTTPSSGETIASFSGNNPLKLLREICASSPAIHPEHSGYLGLELQKAWAAIKDDKIYTQDCQTKNKPKKTQANSVNGSEEHWMVECPECEHPHEYKGYFDSSDVSICENCGCNFVATKLWLDNESYLE